MRLMAVPVTRTNLIEKTQINYYISLSIYYLYVINEVHKEVDILSRQLSVLAVYLLNLICYKT